MPKEYDPRRTTGTFAKIEDQVTSAVGDLLPKEIKKKLDNRRLIRHFEDAVRMCERRGSFPVLPADGKLHTCEEGTSAVFHPLIAELEVGENETLQQILADFPNASLLDYEVSYSRQAGDDVEYTFKPLIAPTHIAEAILKKLRSSAV